MNQDLLLKKKQNIVRSHLAKELTKDIEDTWWKADLAIAIENQILITEVSKNMSLEEKSSTIDIVHKFMLKSIFPNIVSCQSMMGPQGYVYYDEFKSEEVLAKTRHAKTTYKPDIETTSQKIAEEIDMEVLTDISKNSGVNFVCDMSDSRQLRENATRLLSIVKMAKHTVKERSGRGEANWCVTSPLTATLLFMDSLEDFHALKHNTEIGTLEEMRVYCVPQLEPTDIILGFKGHPYDSGYIYCPYVPISFAEGITEEPDSHRMFYRYGKKLIKGGSNYYAKISVVNI